MQKTKASHPTLAATSDGPPVTLDALYDEYLLLGRYVSNSPCKSRKNASTGAPSQLWL
ncbi:MAG: hypothetical protein ACKESB_03730 [Candidatus Hodgkinia cicadicola]